MDTETIDKLFLELSQVTQATTGRELALDYKVQKLTNLLQRYTKEVPNEHIPTDLFAMTMVEL